jgi:hypothetical protein
MLHPRPFKRGPDEEGIETVLPSSAYLPSRPQSGSNADLMKKGLRLHRRK